jgi:DNA-binding protein WhiA
MSFTQQIKNEICLTISNQIELRSELGAIIFNIGKIVDEIISITTENIMVAKRIRDLIKEIYDIEVIVTVRKGYNFNKRMLYILDIQEKTNIIVEDLGLKNCDHSFLYADNESFKAYIKGLFLAVGSVNDPKKSRYHLEFLVNNEKYSNLISKQLNEVYKLNSKVLQRDDKYMIYIKEAEKISDFLRILQANNAVMYYEDIRIYRDHKNMTNRLNNCEQANVEKSIFSAQKEVEAIDIIVKNDFYEAMDEKLKEAAFYRKKYQEASLQELSEIITIETGNQITKSGLSHRMRKIKELAAKIKDKETKI